MIEGAGGVDVSLTLFYNPQRNRIIKNYFSNTSRYDYDDFQGCIFIAATKEQLLALNESDEHSLISGFYDE